MREKNYWDDISDSYDKNYRNSWSLNEDREIEKILSSIRTTGSPVRVLDLGCGTGLGFKLIQSQYAKFEYVGVDASSRMLDQAKKNTEFLASSDTEIQFHNLDAISFLQATGNAEFDIVLALNATGSYIAKTRSLFRQCARVLRPGGTALLSFLNRHSVRRILRHSLCSVREENVSRGNFHSSLSAPAVTLRKKEVLDRLKPLEPESVRLYYQSVLGGVWETDQSLLAEKILKVIVPSRGHTINVLFRTRKAE